MDMAMFIWDTMHDQANGTMAHVFANGVNCTISWKHGTCTLELRDKVVDVFPFGEESYRVDDHTRVLVRIAAIAQAKCPFGGHARRRKLKRIRHELFGL